MSPPAAFAALVRQRHPLLPRIFDFNLRPSRTLHPSWAETMFAPRLWQRLSAHRASEAMLSRHLLEQLGLAEDVQLGFEAPAARLALLDGPVLLRLIQCAGLVAQGPAVRAALDGERVRRLRAVLGDDAYAFCLTRAPLLRPGTAEPADPETIAAAVDESGRLLLGRVLAGQPVGLMKRLMLKLPKGTRIDPTAADPTAWRLLARILEETDPQWSSLFADLRA